VLLFCVSAEWTSYMYTHTHIHPYLCVFVLYLCTIPSGVPHAAVDIMESALFLLVMWFDMVLWNKSLYKTVEMYGIGCLEEFAGPQLYYCPENWGSSCLINVSTVCRLHGITSQIAVLRRNMTLTFIIHVAENSCHTHWILGGPNKGVEHFVGNIAVLQIFYSLNKVVSIF
jgi:hypothetical protein